MKELAMSLLRTAAIAALMTSASIAAANAADAITLPVTTTEELPVYEEPAGFDWTGFYAGVYGVATVSPAHGTEYGVGLLAGANYAFDFFVLGAEAAVHTLDTDSSYVQVTAKAGVIPIDDMLLYAAGGYGVDAGPPDESHALVGGGLELAVTDQVSLRGQYLHGFALTGGNSMDQVTLGANFHF
jgi:outer membrane immunogenic protein